ncbi:hypothetical protein EB118_20155 [bacterium]|nr:hypothetical protein [bacterium]
MKDTRPVHMGTFELQKKHTNAEIDKIKQDVIVHQRCLNSLYNRDQASKREPEEEEETETEETEQLSDYYREFYPDEFPDVPDEDIDLDSFEE